MQIPVIEIHNSGSRARKRCRFRFVLGEVLGWVPRKRARALFLGSAIDAALKAYYYEGSRGQYWARAAEEAGNTPVAVIWDNREFPNPELQTAASIEALEAYFIKAAEVDIDDEITAEWDELYKLAYDMWYSYLEVAPGLDRGIEVIEMDRRFTGRVGEYQDPMTGDTTEILYGGEFDGVWLIKGILYIDENKTSSMMKAFLDSLDRDEQASRYNWALVNMVQAGAYEHLGIARDTPVGGSLFNVLNKKTVTAVKVNQNGTISKSALNNSVRDYCAALEEHRGFIFPDGGIIPGGTKRFAPLPVPATPWALSKASTEPDSVHGTVMVQPYVKVKGTTKDERDAMIEEWNDQHVPTLMRIRAIDWQARVTVDRNPAALDITHQQLYWEGVEELELRQHPERGFRTPTFQCAIDCSFLDPCTASLRGEPIDGLMQEFYWNKLAGDNPDLVELTADDVPELVETEDVGW